MPASPCCLLLPAHNTVSGNLNHWPDTLSCAQQTGSQQYTHFEEIVYQGIHDSVSAVPQHEVLQHAVPQHEVPLPLSTVIRYKFRASLTRQSGDVRGEAIMLYRVVALLTTTTIIIYTMLRSVLLTMIISYRDVVLLREPVKKSVDNSTLGSHPTAATRGEEQSI